MPPHRLNPSRTTWHITWGTYGTRLHGGDRPTVDRRRNLRGEPFADRDELFAYREKSMMTASAVLLTNEQQRFIESVIPAVCERGGWTYRICAAGPEQDHIHVLCDVDAAVHGKDARKWMKRWVTEALDAKWERPEGGSWWAEGGSTKVVADEAHLNNAFDYLLRQRASAHPWPRPAERAGPCVLSEPGRAAPVNTRIYLACDRTTTPGVHRAPARRSVTFPASRGVPPR